MAGKRHRWQHDRCVVCGLSRRLGLVDEYRFDRGSDEPWWTSDTTPPCPGPIRPTSKDRQLLDAIFGSPPCPGRPEEKKP